MKTYNSVEDFASGLRGTKYQEFQRAQFWSLVAYPTAGSAQLNLFGDAVAGSVNRQQTNLPRANSFGDVYFLMKSVQTRIYIASRAIASAAGTDATSMVSDFLNGFAQAGVFTFNVNSKNVIEVTKPFLRFAGNDACKVATAGVQALTLAEGTPNTLSAFVSSQPYGEPISQLEGSVPYVIEPAMAIQPNASFNCAIAYPTGLVPAIATTQITGNAVLYVGVEFDGIVARPIA